MNKISLCLTNYNRFELLMESFKYVLDDERISEIVISDDCSDLKIYNQVAEAVKDMPKVRLFRNINNKDCYQNKMVAVSLATNEWVLLGDSDNIFMQDYLNEIYKYEWHPQTLFAPSQANPEFDYSAYSGVTVTKENVSHFMDMPMFPTLLNTMNYFVNKHEYLRVWDGSIDPVTSDSIFQNYNWLKHGNKIFVVPNLHYFHLVHPQSHYQNNHKRTGNLHAQIEQQLKSLL